MAQNVVYWKFENEILDIKRDEIEEYTEGI